MSLFRSATMFDAEGRPALFSNSGHFQQFLLNPYLELGLTPRNTIVVNAYIPWLNFTNSYGQQTSAGFGDVELGWRRRLNSVESPWAFSGQFTVLFPTYPADREPAPGNHQVDLEGRALLGRGLRVAHRHAFYNLELAYRYRNGAPADQVRGVATVGWNTTHWLMLLGEFDAMKGLRNGTPASPISNPNAQSDFDLYKYQPSAVFALGHGARLQIGMNSVFSGRNTGCGHTSLLSLWKSF